MPRSAAIRAAVCGWSPVIISTRTPAARASAIACRASGRGGSMSPDEPEIDELALDRFALGRPLRRRQGPVGDRERPEREIAEPLDAREDLASGEAPSAAARRPATRSSVQRGSRTSGAPLVTTAMPTAALDVRVERAHQLPLRRERHLADALESRTPRLGQSLDLRLGDEEGGLGGIALDRPLAVLLAQHGVVREAAGLRAPRAPRRGAPDRRAAARRRAARPRAGSRCR